MYFGAGVSLENHLDSIADRIEPWTRILLLRLKRARNPDAVGIALLDHFVDRMQARSVEVVPCGVREGMYSAMETSGLADKIGRANIFREQPVRETSTLMALRHARERMGESCPRCGGRGGLPADGVLHYVI
ncbi:MAG: sodium-independent anion transporter [Alphaproteobacteria bacterium]